MPSPKQTLEDLGPSMLSNHTHWPLPAEVSWWHFLAIVAHVVSLMLVPSEGLSPLCFPDVNSTGIPLLNHLLFSIHLQIEQNSLGFEYINMPLIISDHFFHCYQNDLKSRKIYLCPASVGATHHGQADMVAWMTTGCETKTPISHLQTESRVPAGTRGRHTLQGLVLVTYFWPMPCLPKVP